MPCLARYTTVKHQLKFGDGKHRFWIEMCCGNACDAEMCEKCCKKTQKKTQDSRTFDHGIITGPYPKESHMYDSPWYHSVLEKYGRPKASDLDIAMEAQRKARGGKEVVVAAVMQQEVEKPQEKPKKGGRKKATEPVQTNEPKEVKPKAPKESKESKEAKPKAPRKSKKTLVQEVVTPPPAHEVSPPVLKVPETVAFVETTDDPIRLDNVIRVLLKPFTNGSHKYWRDAEREKLYKRLPDGKRGDYVGRWNSDTKTIDHDAPDSDDEEL